MGPRLTSCEPAGMQTLTVNGKTDIWPSWYNASKNSGVAKETLTFNRYNHLLASSCTNENYKIEIEVTKITDPMTGKENVEVPSPYNKDASDTCDYVPPSVTISVSGDNIVAAVSKGTYNIAGYTLYVDGVDKGSVSIGSGGIVSGYTLKGTEKNIKLTISDTAGYYASSEVNLTS